MSLMFPTIFALGIKGLGVNTKIGGSLLVMGVAGGGAFTPLMGLISKTNSMALRCWCPWRATLYRVVFVRRLAGSPCRTTWRLIWAPRAAG